MSARSLRSSVASTSSHSRLPALLPTIGFANSKCEQTPRILKCTPFPGIFRKPSELVAQRLVTCVHQSTRFGAEGTYVPVQCQGRVPQVSLTGSPATRSTSLEWFETWDSTNPPQPVSSRPESPLSLDESLSGLRDRSRKLVEVCKALAHDLVARLAGLHLVLQVQQNGAYSSS